MCGGSDDDVAKVQPVFDALKPEGESGFVHAGQRRRRPLRQDGPQRHRVRHHAGLRRGLGAAGGGRPGRRRHARSSLLARGHRDPVLAARPAGRGAQDDDRTSTSSRGYADDSGEGRWTVEAAIDNAVSRCRRSPPRCSPASPPGRTSRPAMKTIAAHAQPVRRPRGADRGACRRRRLADELTGPASRPERPEGAEVYVAHLTLADFRSYAGAEVALEPGRHGVRRPQRPGQDQPGRGDRLPRAPRHPPGRRPTRRWSGPAPSGRGPCRRGAATAAQALVELEINPGKVQPGPASTAPTCRAPARCSAWSAPCCSRPRTWPWSRATRRAPRASSTTCW